jgi:hypothetical protein
LEELGWHGDWPVRYLYFRDRKSLATQQFMVFGYIVALGLVGVQASAALFRSATFSRHRSMTTARFGTSLTSMSAC